MSPAAQQERIQSMCKTLKLDRVAVDYGGLAQTASDQQLPYSDFLEHVLGADDGRQLCHGGKGLVLLLVRPELGEVCGVVHGVRVIE